MYVMDGKRYDYSVLTKTTESLKCLFHPVYLSDNPSHHFYVVPPKVSGAKNVAGPVHLTKTARRKYAVFPTFRKQLQNEESAPPGAAC